MRVLHLDAGRTFRGGQRQLALLAAGQREDPDLTVRVLASDRRLVARLTRDGLDVERWLGPAPAGLLQLTRSVRAFRPDVLHAHDARAHGALRLLRSPGPLVVHRRIDDPPRRRAITRWKYRRGRFICVSEAIRRVLLEAGIPADRLHVVRSAVPVPDAPPGGPRPSGPALRLLSVGALVHHKGHEILLRALARTRAPHRLVLVGAGPLADRLARLASQLDLGDRVELAGDVAPRFEACDLFVHPSRTEGLGTAVLDAMAAGRPVLASRTGGLPEIVAQGETGWLVPPDDPEALALAIDHASRKAPAELGRLGRTGWSRARAHHRVEAMVAGTCAVYHRALQGE